MKRDTMKRPIALATGIVFTLLFEVNPAFAAPPTGPTDLAVTMTAAPATVAAGTDLTYIINVTNNGPALATGVTVRDTLPAGVTFVSANVNVMGDTGAVTRCRHEAGATGTGGTVSCTIGSLYPKPVSRAGLPPILDPAHPFSATVVLVVQPIAAGAISNVASARADLRDNNPDNNSARFNSTVTWGSDSMQLVNLSPPSGTTLSGVLNWDEALTSTNSVEATIRYRLASTPQGYVGLIGPTIQFSNQARVSVLRTSLDGPLTYFPRGRGEVRVRFSWICRDGSPQFNKLTAITYSMSRVNPAAVLLQKTENVDYTFTCRQRPAQTPPVADLQIFDAAAAPDPALAGNTVRYTIRYANEGPSPATGVTLTLPLPAGVAFFPAASDPRCGARGGYITCTVGDLRARPNRTDTFIGAETLFIAVTPTLPGRLNVRFEVRAAEHDSNTANNVFSNSTSVQPAADLALVKTASVVSGLMGSAVTYQLTVTNNGPSPATNVVVTDALPLPSSLSRGSSISPVPAGPPTVAFVSAQPSQGSCNLSGVTLTCPLGNLGLGNPGAPATATITIMLRVTESQTLRNSAGVIATEYDPRSGNNTAAIATTVAGRPVPGAQPLPSPAVPAQPSLPSQPPPQPMIPAKPPLPGAPSKSPSAPSK